MTVCVGACVRACVHALHMSVCVCGAAAVLVRPHAGLFGTLLEEMMHNHMHQGYEEGSYFEDGDIDMRVDDDYDVDDDVDDGDDFFDYDGGTSDFFMQPNRRTEESFGEQSIDHYGKCVFLSGNVLCKYY